MNQTEETFIKTFVARDKRSRWLSLIAKDKTRLKLTQRLSHVFHTDLDSRFIFDKEEPPTDIKVQVERVLEEWKAADPNQMCHLIADYRDKDGIMMNLQEAESDYDLAFGVIIIVIPDKLAFYHPERDNISRQPCKILFRPG